MKSNRQWNRMRIGIAVLGVVFAASFFSGEGQTAEPMETLNTLLQHAGGGEDSTQILRLLNSVKPYLLDEYLASLTEGDTESLRLMATSLEKPKCLTPLAIRVVHMAMVQDVTVVQDVIDLFGKTENLDRTYETPDGSFEIHYTVDASDSDAVPDDDNNGTADGDGHPDYVERVGAFLESTRQVYDNWGYRLGYTLLHSKYQIDVRSIGGYGVTFSNLVTGSSSITIDTGMDWDVEDESDLLSTCAHEYYHACQARYDLADLADPRIWVVEGTATWVEAVVARMDYPYAQYPMIDEQSWWRSQLNEYLASPWIGLTDETGDGYPQGIYWHMMAENTRVDYNDNSGSSGDREAIVNFWDGLNLFGWSSVPRAISHAVRDAADEHDSFDETFTDFVRALWFKQEWFTDDALHLDQVDHHSADMTGNEELTYRGDQSVIHAIGHYGAEYFLVSADQDDLVNIDFAGTGLDRGLLGTVYPNFEILVYPGGDYNSGFALDLNKAKGNATVSASGTVIVVARLDDGDIRGVPDGTFTLRLRRIEISPSVASMDFEDGSEGARIRSSIPGMFFTTTQGYDWVYADIRTGNYNVYPYGSGAYSCNGDFFAWLGPNQGSGRIDFVGATAKSVSMKTSNNSGLYLKAYDANNILIDYDHTAGNLGTRRLDEVTVSGEQIAYVLVHDQGNYWLIDDLVVEDLLRSTAAYLSSLFSIVYQVTQLINPGAAFSFSVENSQPRDLQLLLNWGGSTFRIDAYSPDDSLWGSWISSAPPVITEIPRAKAGTWSFVITALDIPYDDYPFACVLGATEPPADTTPPVISIVSPVDGETYYTGAPVHFEWSVDDPETGVASCNPLLDGMPIVAGLDSLITRVGDHVLEVSAVNGIGMTTTTSVTFSVYDFDWLAPITMTDSAGEYHLELTRNSTLPVKFTIYAPNGDFVTDSSARVVVEGTTAEFEIGTSDTCIRIDLEESGEEKYIVNLHTNFKQRDYGIQVGEPYRLKVFFGRILAHQVILTVAEPAAKQAGEPALPASYNLMQNHPNPFNPETEISFSLPEAAEVSLDVFNLLGQKVATIFEGDLGAGTHSFTWDGSSSASGVYLYRLSANDFADTRKMILLK